MQLYGCEIITAISKQDILSPKSFLLALHGQSPPQTLDPATASLSVTVLLPLLKFYIHFIYMASHCMYVIFSVWLLSLRIMFFRCTSLLQGSVVHPFSRFVAEQSPSLGRDNIRRSTQQLMVI